MHTSPLLSAAVSAAVPIAQSVTESLAGGLSFAATLAERIASGGTDGGAGGGSEVQKNDADLMASLPTSWTHARRLAQQSLDDFLVDFRELATQHDVDGSQPIELKSNGRGGAVVAGDHPERTKIEQMLDARPDLAAKFHRLAAAQTTAFQLSQPEQRLRGEFRLVIQPNEVEVLFE